MVKTSLDIPDELWQRVKHRVIDERRKLRDVLVRALEAYLKTPIQGEGEGKTTKKGRGKR